MPKYRINVDLIVEADTLSEAMDGTNALLTERSDPGFVVDYEFTVRPRVPLVDDVEDEHA